MTKVCEPVPEEWTASNREPASDSEICRMSPEQYREWRTTGRKPATGQETGEGNAERFSRASDARHGYRSALTADELRGLTDAERFSRASDARNNIGGRPEARAEAIRRRRSE